MINQSGPDGCTEQTSGLDLLVGPARILYTNTRPGTLFNYGWDERKSCVLNKYLVYLLTVGVGVWF